MIDTIDTMTENRLHSLMLENLAENSATAYTLNLQTLWSLYLFVSSRKNLNGS